MLGRVLTGASRVVCPLLRGVSFERPIGCDNAASPDPSARHDLLRRALTLLLPLTALAMPIRLPAQLPPDTGGAPAPALIKTARITSLGQPPRLKPYLAGMLDWTRDSDPARVGGDLTAGVYRDILNPMIGALGIAAEANLGWVDEWRSGVRALARSPALALAIGAEHQFGKGGIDLVVSITPPVLRGGIVGRGSALRLDWVPTRKNSWRLGLTIPIAQPWMGKTRPRAVRVTLPPPPNRREMQSSTSLDDELEATLAGIARGASAVTHFTYGFFDNSGHSDLPAALERFRTSVGEWRERLEAYGTTRDSEVPTFTGVVEGYHNAVERAFALAVGEVGGEELYLEAAGIARRIILEEVLLPYNRLIGQAKANDSLRGFYPAAISRFQGRLESELIDLDARRRESILLVFQRLLEILEENRKRIRDFWRGDSRQVWIPLQLALRPEEHDTQEEIDALIEVAIGREFTSGNLALPVENTWFTAELIESLHEAEEYHVLWLHDYRGYDQLGAPDTMSFLVSVQGYLGALREAVREYDERGTIPSFFIFLDQNGYEATGGRLWMTLLEDPLGRIPDLGLGYREMQAEIEGAQAELRAAVRASERLQREVEVYGEEWLRELIKVHVSVTYPADFSFRSSLLLTWIPSFLPVLPDELMRDHRKVAFYDITERDPRRGRAILTGTGVGEQYVVPTWEDRGVILTGPALVGLKDAARNLLLDLGFEDEEIPAPLRPLPYPVEYDSLVAELEAGYATARAMTVQNEVGFGAKEATLVHAILYTLMPSGCLIYVPDSLWLSSFWAGQLVGAAFRGCDVRIIAPALANAPATARPVMARSRALITRLFEVQELLQDLFNEAGGSFRVGLYTNSESVDDLAGMVQRMVKEFDENPFLRADFPFSDAVHELLADLPDSLSRTRVEREPLNTDSVDHQTKLHRKTQLLGMRSVLEQIAREIDPQTMSALLKDLQLRMSFPDSVPGDLQMQVRAVEPLISRLELLPDSVQEHSLLFALVGSMNKDPRSMMLDGEVLLAVAGRWALVHYLDFALLAGRTTWLSDRAQLDELIPPYGRIDRWIGRILRDLF